MHDSTFFYLSSSPGLFSHSCAYTITKFHEAVLNVQITWRIFFHSSKIQFLDFVWFFLLRFFQQVFLLHCWFQLVALFHFSLHDSSSASLVFALIFHSSLVCVSLKEHFICDHSHPWESLLENANTKVIHMEVVSVRCQFDGPSLNLEQNLFYLWNSNEPETYEIPAGISLCTFLSSGFYYSNVSCMLCN